MNLHDNISMPKSKNHKSKKLGSPDPPLAPGTWETVQNCTRTIRTTIQELRLIQIHSHAIAIHLPV